MGQDFDPADQFSGRIGILPHETELILFYDERLEMKMETKSVQELCQERKITVQELAEKSGLDEQRTLAIALGRWTPSPKERDAVAAVFGLTREQITWGHNTPIQHIYGHGPG